jgi:hypothetical protein
MIEGRNHGKSRPGHSRLYRSTYGFPHHVRSQAVLAFSKPALPLAEDRRLEGDDLAAVVVSV